MTVIDGVARVVVEAEQEHVVELSRPEVSVVVEVVNKITGVCVVGDSQYASLNKFNIRTCLESGIRDLNTVITKKQMDQIKEVEAKAAGGAGGAAGGAGEGVTEEGKDE